MNDSRPVIQNEPSAPAHEPDRPETPAGQWPEPTSRGAVFAAGALWAAWVGFLVWMMILRLNTAP